MCVLQRDSTIDDADQLLTRSKGLQYCHRLAHTQVQKFTGIRVGGETPFTLSHKVALWLRMLYDDSLSRKSPAFAQLPPPSRSRLHSRGAACHQSKSSPLEKAQPTTARQHTQLVTPQPNGAAPRRTPRKSVTVSSHVVEVRFEK